MPNRAAVIFRDFDRHICFIRTHPSPMAVAMSEPREYNTPAVTQLKDIPPDPTCDTQSLHACLESNVTNALSPVGASMTRAAHAP